MEADAEGEAECAGVGLADSDGDTGTDRRAEGSRLCRCGLAGRGDRERRTGVACGRLPTSPVLRRCSPGKSALICGYAGKTSRNVVNPMALLRLTGMGVLDALGGLARPRYRWPTRRGPPHPVREAVV